MGKQVYTSVYPVSLKETFFLRKSVEPTLLFNTVKLDHHRDQQNVVLIHRWSLYAGSITWKEYTWGPVICGLYKQVVFIYRWSLEQA